MLDFDRLKIFIPLEFCKIKEELFNNRLNSTISIPNEYFSSFIGLNYIGYNKDYQNVVIEITGRINATKGYLGFINKNNIYKALEKVKATKYVDFNTKKVLEIAEVGVCHITKDITVNDIFATKFDFIKHVKLYCNKYIVIDYEYGGIDIHPIPKTRKDKLTIYPKFNELSLEENRIYRNIIGTDFMYENENLLRFELQLNDYRQIRRFFDMEKNQPIMLKDLLNSSKNPLMREMSELGLLGGEWKSERKNGVKYSKWEGIRVF